ncbi:MAG: metallophosphoesterase family protein [Chloroflexi bacterium]|nr:metallophosphoesterase family protein [Chloroflexota bacterium]
MKIAVISDIHGNIPAMQTVIADIEKWRPDRVVVDGDIVNRGPRSRDCLQWVLDKQDKEGWEIVRGNHEDYILECDSVNAPISGPEFEVSRFAHWTYQQLTEYLSALANLPESCSIFAPDGSEMRIVHGSMRDNRDGVYTETKDDELRKQIAPAPRIFVTGHTHRPLIRHVDDTTVVNIGSVGASFDSDRRLCYGRFTWNASKGWDVELVRLSYDFARLEQDYKTSGFLDGAGPLAQLMLVEHRRASGLVYRWASRFQSSVLAGEISMEASVRMVLEDEDLRPFLTVPGWTAPILVK